MSIFILLTFVPEFQILHHLLSFTTLVQYPCPILRRTPQIIHMGKTHKNQRHRACVRP